MASKQVTAITLHYYAETVALDNVFNNLITSSMVHLHPSLLPVPDCSRQPFPLSVQYQFITKQAPRGGLQPPLAQRL